MLSFRLARNNLRKNLKTFAPFLLACITFFVIMFVAASIMLSPSVEKMRGGASLAILLQFAFVVLAIFSLVVIIYSYRFLQLRRTREFGLYDILGFGKVNVLAVALWELVLNYFITLIIGTIIGSIFSKFLFLIYVNLIGGNYFNLIISPLSIILVALVLIGIFVVLAIIAGVIIARNSSLNLLKQAGMGEKEPRSNLLFAGLALVLLVIGYKIAVSVGNPVQALQQFFIAVILVIAGTYFFYISFTIWYLKWRKKRKSYYQPRNFITISSLLYRMKANAAGLASITILLSMTVVTLIVTIGLFAGTQSIVQASFPMEGKAMSMKSNLSTSQFSDQLEKFSDEHQVSLKDLAVIEQASDVLAVRDTSDDETFKVSGGYGSLIDKNTVNITMTTEESLHSLGIKDFSNLGNNEVAFYDFNGNTKAVKTLSWYGQDYRIAGHLSSIGKFPVPSTMAKSLLVVFHSNDSLKAALQRYNQATNNGDASLNAEVQNTAFFNISTEDQKTIKKVSQKSGTMDTSGDLAFAFLSDGLKQQRAEIGGFVFIGFVLGISFVLGAALIIYYKQLSEGIQDQRNFRILQEVGLSKAEVAKTIKTQVRMIFFLPIIITVIHFAFAYRMIAGIEKIFNVSSSQMVGISVATIVGLILIYWLIYKVTSRVYYHIVER